jgi:SAM-dependent methyltransferase
VGAVFAVHGLAEPGLGERLELAKLCLGVATVVVFLNRGRSWLTAVMVAALALSAYSVGQRSDVIHTWRSFFGVVRLEKNTVSGLGGEVKLMAHGTTLHGAQAQNPRYRCQPLLYYAPDTPIGQVFRQVKAAKPAMRVGAVGLGSGAVASYTRPGDRLTFFEIDPQVVRISSDPKNFSYTTECAGGKIDYVVGDARLTLARQPTGVYDILLIDAFSSDSIPAHLLTVEAVRGYLTHLKPDGVLILHLSNRNLELRSPAQAVALAAGGAALLQRYPAYDRPRYWESAEDAVIVGRNTAALAPFAADNRWTSAKRGRPWTDDYSNLIGALAARAAEVWRGG